MATNTQRSKYGGPSRVVLVLSPAPLLQRMVEVVESTEGAELAGGFSTAAEAIEWAVWERQPWHLAYVDVTLPDGSGEALVKHLRSSPRAGTVIGISAHLWKEVRARLATLGVSDIIEKGDVVAFRGDLEARLY